jgi:hypothetical protein
MGYCTATFMMHFASLMIRRPVGNATYQPGLPFHLSKVLAGNSGKTILTQMAAYAIVRN